MSTKIEVDYLHEADALEVGDTITVGTFEGVKDGVLKFTRGDKARNSGPRGRPKSFTDEQTEAILSLREQGWTREQIAIDHVVEILGKKSVHVSTISRAFTNARSLREQNVRG